MTMEEVASNSIEINRNIRVDLHEILAVAEGLGKLDRDRLVPMIKTALDRSKDMPTAYDVIAAKGGIGRT